jgi:hypothetical protein
VLVGDLLGRLRDALGRYERPETPLKRPDSSGWLDAVTEDLGAVISCFACVSVAIATCGRASRGAPTYGAATQRLEHVRAFRRATRSAIDSASMWARASAPSARHPTLAGRRLPEAQLRLEEGGPNLLTEDRQKPWLEV